MSESFSNAKQELLRRRLKGQGLVAPVGPSIQPPHETGSAPLSFAQQRLWLLDQLQSGNKSAAYNLPKAVRLRGHLNRAALRGALLEVVKRHEVLRTTYEIVHDEPRQFVQSVPVFILPEVDLTNCPDAADALAKGLLCQQSRRPFKLSSTSPLRAMLLRLSCEDHILLIVIHHIASDGWSTGILLAELT